MPRAGKRIVIDADVASAASETDYPRSVCCREFLETVAQHQVRVAFSSDLEKEWRRHTSRWTQRWLANMVSRRRLVELEPVDATDIDEAVHAASEDETIPPTCAARAEKDLHLVALALAADQSVASMDEWVRKCFAKLIAIDKDAARRLKPIVWVNPERPEDNAVWWAKAGCPNRPALRLGAERS